VDERFIPLATIVRAAAHAPAARVPQTALPVPPTVVPEVVDFAHADVVHDCALMRLAALEAFEAGTARMLTSLAGDVLARELLLGPADIAALLKRALAAFVEHEPVSIAVSPADAERVRVPLPVRVDSSLAAGDLIVHVRDGAFESSFSFRLQDALERASRSYGGA